MKQTKTNDREYVVIRLKQYDDFPVVISWAEGEDLKIQFAKHETVESDEIMDAVMQIVKDEMGEILDADI